MAALALAAASAPAYADAQAAPPPPTPLPADLQALEQKMQAAQPTSLRFVVKVGLALSHPSRETHKLTSLLGLETAVSGEETTSPPAANVKLSFLGVRLTLRIVGGITYLYESRLARAGHGWHWLRLPGGLTELFSYSLPPRQRPRPEPLAPTIGQPSYAEPPFAKLRETLAGAQEVRELGAGVADGQPVTRFLAKLRPGQLGEHPSPHARFRGRGRRRRPLPAPTVTLEVAFTSSGVPVHFLLAVHAGPDTTNATLDFPAVNFPLVIEPPSPAETISVAQLRALEARSHPRHRRHGNHVGPKPT